jgi:hypothetical protein
LADERADADDDPDVDRRDEGRERTDHHRLVDDNVDVVEPVLEDGEADREGDEHEGPGDDRVLDVRAERRGSDHADVDGGDQEPDHEQPAA